MYVSVARLSHQPFDIFPLPLTTSLFFALGLLDPPESLWLHFINPLSIEPKRDLSVPPLVDDPPVVELLHQFFLPEHLSISAVVSLAIV